MVGSAYWTIDFGTIFWQISFVFGQLAEMLHSKMGRTEILWNKKNSEDYKDTCKVYLLVARAKTNLVVAYSIVLTIEVCIILPNDLQQ
jgi:hypothetical protein